jgi:DNA-binding MarR family transcriptional regulator
MPKDKNDAGVTGAVIIMQLERLTRLVRSAEHGDDLNPAQWEAMRYVSRANRFSNTPTGLTRYLGATKGTISQTLKALERKGYVAKAVRPEERRSVALTVTAKGLAALEQSAWTRLAQQADELPGKTRRRLHKGLRTLLDQQLAAGQHTSFGTCDSCRHFSDGACAFFEADIPPSERTLLCVAHAADAD